MIIKKIDEAALEKMEGEGIKDVYKQVLIGPSDGSANIVMRLFTVKPNGCTPFHTHDFEHVVKVEHGEGAIVNKNGEEIKLEKGMAVYVEPNEKHQFKNTGAIDFKFICIIPNIEKC